MSSGAVQKIRTFKADLEAARSNDGTTNISESKIAAPKVISTTIETPNTDLVPPVPTTKDSVEQEQIKPIAPANPAATRVPLPKVHKIQSHKEEGHATLEEDHAPDTDIVKISTKDTREAITKEVSSFSPVADTGSEEIKFTEDDITNGIEKGTIVSNKKVEHYSLFRAFKDNVSSWQKNKRRNAIARKKAEPKVTTVESRIDTLKKAAKTSYRAPQSDHGILLKQLKKRDPQEEVKSNIVIKQKDQVPKPRWEHTTEQNNVIETAGLIKNIPPKIVPDKKLEKTESVPTITKTNSADGERHKKPISVYQWPQQTEIARERERENITPKTQTDKKPIPINKEAPLAKKNEPEIKPVPSIKPEVKPVPEFKPEVKPVPEFKPEVKTEEKIVKKHQVSLQPILIGVVATICVGVIGAGGWYLVDKLSSAEITETILPNQNLIFGDTDYLISLNNSSDTIFTTIYNHMIESRNLTTHTFITDNNIEADPNDVVSTLGLRLTGSFARSLTNLTIGSIDGTEPFIVMRATNFDTAFAGMLTWEKSLSTDVSPLFGQPVSESFDSDARTDTQIRSAFYKDAIVANTSVRVLRDDTNTSRIIYGFADPNTIVITTNESTYKQLLERLQQQR